MEQQLICAHTVLIVTLLCVHTPVPHTFSAACCILHCPDAVQLSAALLKPSALVPGHLVLRQLATSYQAPVAHGRSRHLVITWVSLMGAIISCALQASCQALVATHSHLQKDPGVIQPSQGSPVSAPFPGHNGRELEEPTAPWLMMSPTPGSMALPGKQQASWGCTA